MRVELLKPFVVGFSAWAIAAGASAQPAGPTASDGAEFVAHRPVVVISRVAHGPSPGEVDRPATPQVPGEAPAEPLGPPTRAVAALWAPLGFAGVVLALLVLAIVGPPAAGRRRKAPGQFA